MRAGTFTIFAALCVAAASSSRATPVLKHREEATTETFSYDYVVVGGGLAGLTVADSIAANSRYSVLVLEAGPDPTGNPIVSVPAFCSAQIGTELDWNYTTTGQSALDGNSIYFQQGRMYGGGSGANYMAYCRGSTSVYDEWATISGDDGWKWSNLQNDFKAGSAFSGQQTDAPVAPVDQSWYGNGPLQLSFPKRQYNFGTFWMNAWQKATKNPLPLVDKNTGTGIGATWTTFTIAPNNASRSYSLTAYGYDLQAQRSADVFSGSTVKRVIIDTNGNKPPRASGVEYVDSNGVARTVRAKREVILSAGAFGTPKLLQLSGVGAMGDLKSLGVQVVKDLPEVGNSISDHFFSVIQIEVTPNITTAAIFGDRNALAQAQADYQNNAAGPFAVSFAAGYANERIPQDDLVKIGAAYSALLPQDRPHFQFDAVAAPLVPGTTPGKNIISFFVANVQPESRGSVKLASGDYRDAPVIDPNVYGTPNDRATILYGYKRLRSILHSDEFKPIFVSEDFPGDSVQSDDDLWAAIKKTASTYHHPMGSAAMGKVVDGQLRVRGVDGLRVVDSSAVPVVATCYPQASIYALARRAANLIIGSP